MKLINILALFSLSFAFACGDDKADDTGDTGEEVAGSDSEESGDSGDTGSDTGAAGE